MMTRKHYDSITTILRHSKIYTKLQATSLEDRGYEELITSLADLFADDNPNFHRGKFIHAAYNEPKTKVDTIPKSMFWKGKAKDFPGVQEVIKQNGSK